MTTLITVGNSEGDRRCDARCHDAKGEKCACICSGANHGVGLQRATEQVQEHFEPLMDELHKLGITANVTIAIQLPLEA